MADFLFGILRNRMSGFRVEKQGVDGTRYNIIARGPGDPKLMFCCHMDTVMPKLGWRHDPNGEMVGDMIYGTGSVDMKGGIAALLDAASKASTTRGLFLLFDVGEEAKFDGIKTFTERYKFDVKPEIAIFPEPGLKIRNAHRGIVDVYFQVTGESGHASNPKNGRNAIDGAYRAIEGLRNRITEWRDPILGETTCNLAYINGGVKVEIDGKPFVISGKEAGNNIPDICEVTLDLRIASFDVNGTTVMEALRGSLPAGCTIQEVDMRYSYGGFRVEREKLAVVERAYERALGRLEYDLDIGGFGFGEAKILQEKMGIDGVYIGPGPTENYHKAEERVSITELHAARDVYAELIRAYCK
jgi:succinyl-diaminopimelate desuccinylase